MIRIFGFEAEFGDNVEEVTHALFQRGLMAIPGLHGYHCSCDYCDFDSEWVFRAQSDSSCGGEIISEPFEAETFWSDQADEVLYALQHAAVEADAAVNRSAGFHVHVSDGRNMGYSERTMPTRRQMLLAWLPFERWLRDEVGSGPLSENRGFNYQMVPMLAQRLWSPYFDDKPTSDGDALVRLRVALLSTCNADRHSTLNLTFDPTEGRAEFRIWNATRTAWRMEMYIRLSLLFTDPAFVLEVGEWTQYCLRGLREIEAWMADPDAVGFHVERGEAMDLIRRYDPRLGELLDKHLAWADATERPRNEVRPDTTTAPWSDDPDEDDDDDDLPEVAVHNEWLHDRYTLTDNGQEYTFERRSPGTWRYLGNHPERPGDEQPPVDLDVPDDYEP